MVLRGGSASPSHGYTGLYYRDTRFVSLYELLIDGRPALPIKSWRSGISINYEYDLNGEPIRRTITPFYDGVRDSVQGGGGELSVKVGFDFSDIFEVRDSLSKSSVVERRRMVNVERRGKAIIAFYDGTDGARRSLVIRSGGEASLKDGLAIVRGGSGRLSVMLMPALGSPERPRSAGGDVFMEFLRMIPHLKSDNNSLNLLYRYSITNIFTLLESPPAIMFPLAGIPWFNCVFGRDSIVTAMQTLGFIPSIAESVIKRLTELIGRSHDKEREEEPGKIIHERREGEISGSVLPFRRYYGTIDATPLYLMLVASYARQSGVDSIKPFKDGVELALAWLLDKLSKDKLGGLLGYDGGALSNQGWKDSWDSVFDSSGGELLGGYPRYLIEVQGYVWEALRSMDEISPGLGLGNVANRVRDKITLFWSNELGFFAEAIDGGEGRLADIYTSNPGHLLWTTPSIAGGTPKRLPRY